MPPDNPRKQDLANLKNFELMPSTIETIDRALFDYIDQELDIFAPQIKALKKCLLFGPVLREHTK